MTKLVKLLFLTTCTLLLAFSFVDVAFANPIPLEPIGSPLQYVLIVFAEVCGLFVGTAVLIQSGQADWRRSASIMSVSLIVSYAIGIAIWSFGYIAGIFVYNSINPLFNYSSHPLSIVVLLLPEFVGTIIGTILIHLNLKIEWKKALGAMAAAMFTSFLIGLLIANIYLRM